MAARLLACPLLLVVFLAPSVSLASLGARWPRLAAKPPLRVDAPE